MPSASVVLVVEDEALIAEDLKSTLEDLGCEVLGPAQNCAVALAILAKRHPGLAFVDTHLGTENCEAVVRRCDELGVPVIITTGHRLHDLPAFCRDRDYIAKPYRNAEVAAALRLYQAGGE